MSPLELEFLLWCYARAERHPRQDDVPYFDVICRFQEHGILAPAPDENGLLRTTKRGDAWVKSILSTPIPQSAWIDPRDGKVIA